MLNQKDLFTKKTKIEIAVERIKTFEPTDGYYLAFSGGKDSIVIKKLADISGVKYDAHYSSTTIDPPEVLRFIRKFHKDVKFEKPKKSFLRLLEHRGFPLRQSRWCCSEFKECYGTGRTILTGIRWAESYNRSMRKLTESCYKDGSKRYLNPIIDWSYAEVWEFIHTFNLPYCELYDQGFSRIGCLFCPCQSGEKKIKETNRYPKQTRLFINAFNNLYDRRIKEGNDSVKRWSNGEEMFNWWIKNDKNKKQSNNQLPLFE